MTSKHYKWQTLWVLDVEAATAAHGSGLKVRFAPADGLNDLPEVGGRCWAADREWLVMVDGGDAELAAWLQEQARHGLRDVRSINARIARLFREAGELWAQQKKTYR